MHRRSAVLAMIRMRTRQRGVALLEVGLALVVLSTAFLAMAMLLSNTARGLRSGQAMAKAAALASDISEQMRSNRAAVEGVAPGRGFVLEGTYDALSQANALTTPTCGGRFVRPPDVDVSLEDCTDAKGLADFSVASWLAQAQTSLPGGAASIVDLGLTRRRIVLAWMEPLTDRNNGAAAPITDTNCSLVTTLAVSAASGLRCVVLDFSL
jgi:Tfp pilus assembly protein PilV